MGQSPAPRKGGTLDKFTRSAAALLTTLIIAGCGGGGESSAAFPALPGSGCDPGNPDTAGDCGTVLLGLTDADGDFLGYTVDVVALSLEKANGAKVEVLPRSTRLDFASYVDLTEIVTAALVPPGTYVAGTLTLDYGAAEVYVEADGDAKEAVVVDAEGTALTQAEFRIVLSDRDQLLITRGRPALLTVDFDLAASHDVDVVPVPAVATAEPFILADVDPVETKDLRVRGPLLEVDQGAMSYTVALRPFHDRAGDFGRMKVNVTEDTEFEVDGIAYAGSEGLEALDAAGRGTMTVAAGTLTVAERSFTAETVLGGDSVPGNGMDAVLGNVIARNGNELTVRGATIVPRDAAAYFHDDVIVTVGPDTRVQKAGHPDAAVTIDDLSIGQRLTALGHVAGTAADVIHLDATQGGVRMHVTHLSGVVNTVHGGQLDLELHSIDRRRSAVFDFSGTGPTPAQDADPANYEVATAALPLDAQAAGKPVVVFGFPQAFGAAPPDFDGETVVDYSDVRSLFGVGWSHPGTTAPFLSTGPDGLLLDHRNPEVGLRHHIRQGPVIIDVTELESPVLIAPADADRAFYSIATRDSLRIYREFSEFIEALTAELDGATTARSMYARGHYDAADNLFHARRAGVYLLDP